MGITVREDLLGLFPGEDIYKVKISTIYLVENHLDYWGDLYGGLGDDEVLSVLGTYDFSSVYEDLEVDLGRGLVDIECEAYREYFIDRVLVELGF